MAATKEKNQVLEKLFREFWDWRMERTPEFSSLAGDGRFNARLEVYTLERFRQDRDSCLEFLKRARKMLDEGEDLGEADKLNLRLFKSELQTFIDGYDCQGFLFPVNYMEGVHIDFQRLVGDWVSPTSANDYRDIIQRFKQFDRQAADIVAVLKEGVRLGKVNHDISMRGVVDGFNLHIAAAPESTAFFAPFAKMPDSVEGREQLKTEAKAAIKDHVQAGMKTIKEFLESGYKTRKDIAATSMPGGDAFYKQCIKFHTSTELTPQEIHDIGLKEVERIEAELNKIKEEVGKKEVPLSQFFEDLRSDPKFYYDSADEVMEGFRKIVENVIAPKIPDIFTAPPKQKLELVANANDGPAAFYIAGTPDGARPGKYFVNTKDFKSQPKYDMLTLSLHEGNPGHHLEASYKIEMGGVPNFRQQMEDRSYYLCPSRFPINTAYVEGWGLYAESLGFDMELYNDPYDRFGHLSAAIFRACRLVVDTGMHALGWSRQQAVQFMLQHSAHSKENVESEVNRYITWPGQALGYKLGELRIRQLRTKAEKALGGKFDLKKFHDVVLANGGPLQVLEQEVDKFIQKSK